MIGFFKNLFNGILSFFTGLFGEKKSQKNKPSITSSAEKLVEATTSSAGKLAEATTSSAEKLAEATAKTSSGIMSSVNELIDGNKSQEDKSSIASSAEKLAEATAKTSSGVLSSINERLGGQKPQENKPSQTSSNKRKRSGYFMELDESEETKPVNGNQQAKDAAAKTSEPVAAAKPAKAEPAKTPKSSAASQSARVELVQTAEGIKAEPTKPSSFQAKASANGQNKTETTFAPKYLAPTPSSNSRRRPGPSMNTFLDMARQVKTPG